MPSHQHRPGPKFWQVDFCHCELVHASPAADDFGLGTVWTRLFSMHVQDGEEPRTHGQLSSLTFWFIIHAIQHNTLLIIINYSQFVP